MKKWLILSLISITSSLTYATAFDNMELSVRSTAEMLKINNKTNNKDDNKAKFEWLVATLNLPKINLKAEISMIGDEKDTANISMETLNAHGLFEYETPKLTAGLSFTTLGKLIMGPKTDEGKTFFNIGWKYDFENNISIASSYDYEFNRTKLSKFYLTHKLDIPATDFLLNTKLKLGQEFTEDHLFIKKDSNEILLTDKNVTKYLYDFSVQLSKNFNAETFNVNQFYSLEVVGNTLTINQAEDNQIVVNNEKGNYTVKGTKLFSKYDIKLKAKFDITNFIYKGLYSKLNASYIFTKYDNNISKDNLEYFENLSEFKYDNKKIELKNILNYKSDISLKIGKITELSEVTTLEPSLEIRYEYNNNVLDESQNYNQITLTPLTEIRLNPADKLHFVFNLQFPMIWSFENKNIQSNIGMGGKIGIEYRY